jgi:hypothetical protein
MASLAHGTLWVATARFVFGFLKERKEDCDEQAKSTVMYGHIASCALATARMQEVGNQK